MPEALFYHLTESTLDEALPGLLERSLARGWRAVVQSGTEERRNALDSLLWTFRDDSFLAHGTDAEPHAAELRGKIDDRGHLLNLLHLEVSVVWIASEGHHSVILQEDGRVCSAERFERCSKSPG